MRKSVIEPSNEITITPSTSPSVASQKTFFSGMITPSTGPSVASQKNGFQRHDYTIHGPVSGITKNGFQRHDYTIHGPVSGITKNREIGKLGNREIEKSMMSFYRDFPVSHAWDTF